MLTAVFLAAIVTSPDPGADLEYLHSVAHEVVNASRVDVNGAISNGGHNTTGYAVRVPGGTQSFYPAFWVRDAAMMLGGDLVPADEVMGWIKVVARTQPGPAGLSFAHGLKIPGYSIPDHITLKNEACWFPGAYANQGVGAYGHLPPADDAFYFIQMAFEACRLSGKPKTFTQEVDSGWGRHGLNELCDRAFDSVAVDATTGLVVCSAEEAQNRVDWGFCDSIRKTGSCLMPSLLRWQAAERLSQLYAATANRPAADRYRSIAKQLKRSIEVVFFQPVSRTEGLLLSATVLGRKDDVWASAFAVSIGALSRSVEQKVATHLDRLYREGGTVKLGQVRQLPPGGALGGSWESATSSVTSYQNGGYWATPTGWLVNALRKVDRKAGNRLLSEYCEYVRANRSAGAPFEWINPDTNTQSNANYASSAGLVYISIAHPGS